MEKEGVAEEIGISLGKGTVTDNNRNCVSSIFLEDFCSLIGLTCLGPCFVGFQLRLVNH